MTFGYAGGHDYFWLKNNAEGEGRISEYIFRNKREEQGEMHSELSKLILSDRIDNLTR
jgi:hypothetical protein